ncbi:MAG: 4Fe-4S binding protein [Calditrichaceae bacterium]|nr:4Fe-4S binding protein [Calditrichaceae bacterium]
MIELISTIKERCRVCYTCVRDCPAKAIRISGGQAEVITSRCIGCGNCVKVCRQGAKQVINSIGEVKTLLQSGEKVAAIIAPSFPAAFPDTDYRIVAGMVKKLGFNLVCEVAFGADLVAREYRKWMDNAADGDRIIATTCPAMVHYVEKYHPSLVSYLAPIVSPMIAQARVIHKLYGADFKVVFIGPCFAKKSEAHWEQNENEVDSVLTFTELYEMLAEAGINSNTIMPAEFDGPEPSMGVLFPINRGIFQAADISYDLISGQVIAAEGKTKFIQLLKEFESGALDSRLLEVLCCDGCIMGPGMSSELPYYTRRKAVSNYAQLRLKNIDKKKYEKTMAKLHDLKLDTNFESSDMRLPLPSKEDLEKILARMGKFGPEDELDCGACGYETCREHAIAIHKGLAESEMCLPYTIDRLKKSLVDLNNSNKQLESTQQALISAEKLAGMGQLSAGIAHEINNPLGVILLYSKMMMEECPADSEKYSDLKMIAEQADRCKTIVAGLLNFARENKVNMRRVDFCELINHGMNAIIIPDNVLITTEHHVNDPMVDLDYDQMIQVLTNLIKNAIEAMPEGGNIQVTTSDNPAEVFLKIRDAGGGIPESIQKKIFEPLFTTKQVGKGTGLGLAVTYGIIKMHRGQIDFSSNCDPEKGPTGTEFVVRIPRNASRFMTNNQIKKYASGEIKNES